MTAERLTPTDELAGMPLSVTPPLERLPRDDLAIANWCHLWHPRIKHPEVMHLDTPVYRLLIRGHNMGTETYHCFYTGPLLPDV